MGTVAIVLLLVFAFRLGFPSPCLVGAALPMDDTEILLLTGPIDEKARWQVYGMDGKPRRAWGDRPLPAGVVEMGNGDLRAPSAAAEPVERLAAGMSRLAPGQTRFVTDLISHRLVHLVDPAGILIERFGTRTSGPELLQRVQLDGSLVWSQSLVSLLGPVDFNASNIELRHAHVQTSGRNLVLILQAFTSSSLRPVDASISRIVIIDSASGRVLSRANVSAAS
jgi:hypothetical protein